MDAAEKKLIIYLPRKTAACLWTYQPSG